MTRYQEMRKSQQEQACDEIIADFADLSIVQLNAIYQVCDHEHKSNAQIRLRSAIMHEIARRDHVLETKCENAIKSVVARFSLDTSKSFSCDDEVFTFFEIIEECLDINENFIESSAYIALIVKLNEIAIDETLDVEQNDLCVVYKRVK